MINYYNFKKLGDKWLLTNDFGRYVFLSEKEFAMLPNNLADMSPESLFKLTEAKFIYEGSTQHFVDNNTSNMRDSKNYLFSATSLHIFVVTNKCNLNCVYCQANNGSRLHAHMDKETAERSVDIALQSPEQNLSFEFQGGEPLCNFEIIKHIVEYTEAKKGDKNIFFSVVTNLTLITDEMMLFFKKHSVSISTSLDGPAFLHNKNRTYSNGAGTFCQVAEKIKKIREYDIPIGAIQTTTKYSLPYASEIVKEYASLGFNNIFIRPLTPLGCAKKMWSEIGYSPEEFVLFYRQVINVILELNKQGTFIQENFASIIFSKLLHGYPVNYMELRSPCGAMVGQMAYYVNGDIFTCDEGRMLFEMGKDAFKLGNVYSNTYNDLRSSKVCRTVCLASTLESLPNCCDCVYSPYCGTCPVVNLALYDDIIPNTPHHYRCKINMGIFDCLFEILNEGKAENIEIIEKWGS